MRQRACVWGAWVGRRTKLCHPLTRATTRPETGPRHRILRIGMVMGVYTGATQDPRAGRRVGRLSCKVHHFCLGRIGAVVAPTRTPWRHTSRKGWSKTMTRALPSGGGRTTPTTPTTYVETAPCLAPPCTRLPLFRAVRQLFPGAAAPHVRCGVSRHESRRG